jgi:hypothetical protein
MKAVAFALLLAVSAAHAADAPAPAEEPRLKVFKLPLEEPKVQIVIPEQPQMQVPPRAPAVRYWICPKDETMLRVVKPDRKGGFECPLDGTRMKPAVGRDSAIFLLQEKPAH